jgi:hypothetical protein
MHATRRSYRVADLEIGGWPVVHRLAVAAEVHPLSILAELRFQMRGEGKAVRGAAGDRARAVLALHGLPGPRKAAQ